MILLDHRTGSSGYLAPLRALGSAAELAGTDLPTDCQWEGNGPGGPILIGAELKTISDLLASLRTGRLAGQQIGPLIESYQVRYLVITGYWRPNKEGWVEIADNEWRDFDYRTILDWYKARGSYRYDATLHAIETICQHGNILPVYLDTPEETAFWLKTTHDWWQQPWDSHSTSERLYVPPIPYNARESAARSTLGLNGKLRWQGKATIVEAWLHALPHMGRKAVTLAQYFKTPADIVAHEDWRDFEGIGKKSATDIHRSIHGEK